MTWICNRQNSRGRTGFSMVELLMVVAILGLLTALLLPAVQSAREASRRSTCLSHARQVVVATLNYAGTHGDQFPPLWRTNRVAPWDNFSWRTTLLPFLESQSTYDHLNLSASPIASENRLGVEYAITVLQCPSTPSSPRRVTELGVENQMHTQLTAAAHDFVAIHDVLSTSPDFAYKGAWHAGLELRIAEPLVNDVPLDAFSATQRMKPAKLKNVRDGFSKTALLVEQAGKPNGLGSDADAVHHPPSEGAWATCDYGSFYGDGINTHNYHDPYGFHRGAIVALCDGSAKWVSEATTKEIIVALLSRDGSEIVEPLDWQ